MASYINVSMSAQQVSSVIGVKGSRVIKLPNGDCLFKIVLWNNVVLLVGCSKRVEVGYREYTQDIWLFDEVIPVSYKGIFNLLFTEYDYGTDHFTFNVECVTEGKRWKVGKLQVNRFGVVILDNRLLERRKIDILLTKAMVLCG